MSWPTARWIHLQTLLFTSSPGRYICKDRKEPPLPLTPKGTGLHSEVVMDHLNTRVLILMSFQSITKHSTAAATINDGLGGCVVTFLVCFLGTVSPASTTNAVQVTWKSRLQAGAYITTTVP